MSTQEMRGAMTAMKPTILTVTDIPRWRSARTGRLPGHRPRHLTASLRPPGAPGPGPGQAGAAMDTLRATAIRTLREHVRAGRRCALCHAHGHAMRRTWRRRPSGRDDMSGAHRGGGEGLVSAQLSWARAFPGTPRHAGAARRFVAGLLEGSPLRDDALVVVSELFTNAVLHTGSGKPGGLVIVQVSRWRLGVRIAVTDQGSPSQPVIRGPAACGEPAKSGNGLYLAGQLAGRLDWHDDPSGRTIAAILGRPTPEQHPPQPATRPGESSRLPQPVTSGA